MSNSTPKGYQRERIIEEMASKIQEIRFRKFKKKDQAEEIRTESPQVFTANQPQSPHSKEEFSPMKEQVEQLDLEESVSSMEDKEDYVEIETVKDGEILERSPGGATAVNTTTSFIEGDSVLVCQTEFIDCESFPNYILDSEVQLNPVLETQFREKQARKIQRKTVGEPESSKKNATFEEEEELESEPLNSTEEMLPIESELPDGGEEPKREQQELQEDQEILENQYQYSSNNQSERLSKARRLRQRQQTTMRRDYQTHLEDSNFASKTSKPPAERTPVKLETKVNELEDFVDDEDEPPMQSKSEFKNFIPNEDSLTNSRALQAEMSFKRAREIYKAQQQSSAGNNGNFPHQASFGGQEGYNSLSQVPESMRQSSSSIHGQNFFPPQGAKGGFDGMALNQSFNFPLPGNPNMMSSGVNSGAQTPTMMGGMNPMNPILMMKMMENMMPVMLAKNPKFIQLNQLNKDLQMKISSLERNLEMEKQNSNMLDQKCQQLFGRLKRSEGLLTSSEGERQLEISRQNAQLGNLQEQIQQEKRKFADSEDENRRLKEEISAIKSANSGDKSALGRLQEQLEDKRRVIENLRERSDEMIKKCNKKETEIINLKTEKEKANYKVEMANDTAENLKKQLRRKENEVERLNGVEARIKVDLDTVKKSLEEVKADRIRLQSDCTNLQDRLEESKREEERLRSKLGTMQRMGDLLEEKDTEINRLQTSLSKEKAQNKANSQDLEHMDNEMRRMEDKLRDFKAEKNRLLDEIESSKRDSEDQKRMFNKERRDLEIRLGEYQDRLEEMRIKAQRTQNRKMAELEMMAANNRPEDSQPPKNVEESSPPPRITKKMESPRLEAKISNQSNRFEPLSQEPQNVGRFNSNLSDYEPQENKNFNERFNPRTKQQNYRIPKGFDPNNQRESHNEISRPKFSEPETGYQSQMQQRESRLGDEEEKGWGKAATRNNYRHIEHEMERATVSPYKASNNSRIQRQNYLNRRNNQPQNEPLPEQNQFQNTRTSRGGHNEQTHRPEQNQFQNIRPSRGGRNEQDHLYGRSGGANILTWEKPSKN